MAKQIRSGHIGILTSGGDTPGLNAAIRGIGKTATRNASMQMADKLQKITGLETSAIDYIRDEQFGIMVAVDGEQTKAVPLGDVVGKINYVPPDHPWVLASRDLATSFGD